MTYQSRDDGPSNIASNPENPNIIPAWFYMLQLWNVVFSRAMIALKKKKN